MTEFTHLHVHTEYSLLDGASKIDKLIKRTVDLGMKSLAITDHGNMYGVLSFTKAARAKGIKPIIGCEMYVTDGSRFDKKGKEDRSGFHLILLAKNLEGYKNLSRLCSKGHLEGFYYTPRVDKELLIKYKEGLIATSACIGGEIPAAIIKHGVEKAEKVLQEYLDIFGDDFYLELMRHGWPEQKAANEGILKLAEKYNVKVIATNDVHYIEKEDSKAHDILICLQTSKDYDDPDRMRYSGKEYLKSPEEMAELFHDVPEAIANTMEIADKIEDFEIRTKNVLLPVFPLPEGFETENEYLAHLTKQGAIAKYGEINDEIKERIDLELGIINKMGFAGYFLIVQDFINEAKNMGVAVGPGRGSAAGSIVAYCTGITDVDPIKYKLLFERFLNPERVSMPDIDIDFDDEGRERVIDYVINKYGRDKVAQIVTFGRMVARSSIRNVARVLKLPLAEADKLAKLVPEKPGTTLEKSYIDIPELSHALKNGEDLVKDTLKYARKLEGTNSHPGVHACGVIIGPTDLIDCIPLSKHKDSDLPVTQYVGKEVEEVGMLKMDFLGLKTLSILKEAVKNIKNRHKKDIDIETIPLDDEKTYELYQAGETIGTFQFESKGMREYLQELKPSNIEDLIAMNALYRPGPMDYIPYYISRKHGKEKASFLHPLLEDILKPTHGIMVYQEQIMQAAQIVGGYSLGSADILRRAMGKKNPDEMAKQKNIFIDGAVEKGVDKKKAEEIFDVMAKFAEYGFNRSHAAAYSILAFKTAYLKAQYMPEYMAAVLTHNLSDLKKITIYMDECNRQSIPVLGPDINESAYNFTVIENGEIRFGLGAVKGVGEGAVENIVEERLKNGEYKNIFDFATRVNLRSVNKKAFEALALSGAFDCFENTHRAQFFDCDGNGEMNFIDKIIKHVNLVSNLENSSQINLFNETEDINVPDPEMPDCPKWSTIEILKKEKEVTGMYISGHPLDQFKIRINSFCNASLEQFQNLSALKTSEFVFAGIITSVKHKISQKSGNGYASFVVEDYTNNYQFFLFTEQYLKFKHLLIKDNSVFLKANLRYNKRTNESDLRISHIGLLSELGENSSNNIVVNLPLDLINNRAIDIIKGCVDKNPGKAKLKINLFDNQEKHNVFLESKSFKVEPFGFLNNLLNKINVEYKLN
ncbi:MAG: DNA polymerase III subunit alpha [Bacteroidota bacterium]